MLYYASIALVCIGITGIYIGIFNMIHDQKIAPLFGIGGFFLFFAGLMLPSHWSTFGPNPEPCTVQGELVSATDAVVHVTGEPCKR